MSHLLTSTRGPCGASSQAERHVGAERRRQDVDLLVFEMERKQISGASQESGRVAAPSSETRADRDALRQTDADAGFRASPLKQLPRALHDVRLARGEPEPARREREAAPRLFD